MPRKMQKIRNLQKSMEYSLFIKILTDNRREIMKNLIFTLTLVAMFVPAFAYAHGGGCRKDSPQGQCCHAGSKPLHCH